LTLHLDLKSLLQPSPKSQHQKSKDQKKIITGKAFTTDTEALYKSIPVANGCEYEVLLVTGMDTGQCYGLFTKRSYLRMVRNRDNKTYTPPVVPRLQLYTATLPEVAYQSHPS
jgi:hypothetical protein